MSRYCPYCMAELNFDARCPYCGKEPESYQYLSHHFPVNELLYNRYYVGRVLGEGGFGITYLGLDTRLKRKVAIKEYFPTGFVKREVSITLEVTCYTNSGKVFYEKGRDQFLKEAQTLAALDRIPGIVQVLDTFTANNTAYIVMELLEGRTFDELLSGSGRIPAPKVLEAIDPVLKAMSVMHAKGIIHRDISPDNIMLLHDGTAKLLDFGCARETANGQTMTVMLKHGYAPIEQYTGRNQGPWTDVYALSATLYHCLTGKKPPCALDRNDAEPLMAPHELGVALTETQEQGMMKGLAIKPEDRWQSISGLYDALYGSSSADASPSTVRLLNPSENRTEEKKTEVIKPKENTDDHNTIQDKPSETTLDNQKDLKEANSSKLIAACALVVILLAGSFVWWNFSKPSETVEPENSGDATQESDEPDGTESIEPLAQGTWWSFEDNVLTIHGTGPMEDYIYDYRPWDDHRSDIKKVVIEDGVTDIGAYSFYECTNINSVQIPTSVTLIDEFAFGACMYLEAITLPTSCQYYEHSFPDECHVDGGGLIPRGEMGNYYTWETKDGIFSISETEAATFSDVDGSNPYATAINVLAALKVIIGYLDGSFLPTDELSRAEAAVLVYRIATGDVDNAYVDNYTYMANSRFTDLDNGYNWATGYINYCQNAGIIKGTSDTTFSPERKVTGYQLMVMVLRMLGYDKAGEFSDPITWEQESARKCEQLGMLDNISNTGNFGNPASREMTAEILFRGLLQDTVQYSVMTPGGYTFNDSTLGYEKFKLEEVTGGTLVE